MDKKITLEEWLNRAYMSDKDKKELLNKAYKSEEEVQQILKTLYKENMPVLDATMKEVIKYVSRIDKIITFDGVLEAICSVAGTEFSMKGITREFAIVDFTLSFTIAQILREVADKIEGTAEYQKIATARPERDSKEDEGRNKRCTL
jgi:DNA-binding transcriptional regulator YbjK